MTVFAPCGQYPADRSFADRGRSHCLQAGGRDAGNRDARGTGSGSGHICDIGSKRARLVLVDAALGLSSPPVDAPQFLKPKWIP